MKLAIFKRLMKTTGIKVHPPEWEMCLEICDQYLKQKKIKNPVTIEVGSKKDSHREFFRQLFNAVNYGADIQGIVDILSISGGSYKEVKDNFKKFSPYCDGIVVIHDIESCRHKKRTSSQSWKLWDELKAETTKGEKGYENFLFIAIHRKRIRGNQRGIGVIIKQ